MLWLTLSLRRRCWFGVRDKDLHREPEIAVWALPKVKAVVAGKADGLIIMLRRAGAFYRECEHARDRNRVLSGPGSRASRVSLQRPAGRSPLEQSKRSKVCRERCSWRLVLR